MMWCERNAFFVFVSVTLSFSSILYRSSRPEVFGKKSALKYFPKLTGNHLCQRLFFKKIARLPHATQLKKAALAQVFPCKFCEFF